MPTPSSDVQRDQRPGAALPQPAATGATGATAPSAAGSHDDADTMRFRAATLEEAIALAERSLGARVRVVAANRIRRGGIGGFFASDLGVEVTVALDDETMEDALARLVAESEADERARWSTRAVAPGAAAPVLATDDGEAASTRSLLESFAAIAARAGAIADAAPVAPAPVAADTATSGMPSVVPALAPPVSAPTVPSAEAAAASEAVEHTVNPVLAEVLAAIMAEAAQARDLERAGADEPPVAAGYVIDPYEVVQVHRPIAPVTPMAPVMPSPPPAPMSDPVAGETGRPVRHHPSPTMVRVEQIIEELSAITAAPVFGDERARPRAARPRLADLGVPRARGGADRDVDPVPAVTPTLPDPVPARPKVLPTLPPRPSDIARAAAAASAASHQRLFRSPATPDPAPVVTEAAASEVAVPAVEVAPVEVAPVEVPAVEVPAVEVERVEPTVELLVEPATASSVVATAEATRLAERPASTRRLQVPVRHADGTGAANAVPAAAVAPSTNAPSRRQVELAVAAADQLIESLSREEGVKRLSVRVVLRTGDQREVEAEAEWEAD